MKPFDIPALVRHVGCGSVDEIAGCPTCDQIRARLNAASVTRAKTAELRAALEVPMAYWRSYFASHSRQHWTVDDEFWRQWLDAYGHLMPEQSQSVGAVDPQGGDAALTNESHSTVTTADRGR